ncbi:MAG: hypothetical protein U0797_25605 [Gemmataceae bacterium]
MLVRAYQFLGVLLLTGYAASSWLGWEFASPLVARAVPPVNAAVGASSSGWSGRSTTYHHYSGSSGGTRSGWGGGGLGGK